MNFWSFFELLLFLLAGQYLHVLIKIRNAYRQFGAEFKAGIFFKQNQFNLILNGSLILIFAIMLGRAGLSQALANTIATVKPFDLFGIVQIPAQFWMTILFYASLLFSGYFIQSIFYWLLKGGLKKTKIEPIEEEKA